MSGTAPAPGEQPVVMRPRRWALPAAVAGCLVFVASSAVLVAGGGAANVVAGLAGLGFFGGGLVMLLLRRPWRWSIVIDDRGVTWRRPGGELLVRWEEVADVRVTRLPTGWIGRPRFVTLTLRHPRVVDQPLLGPLNRPLQGLNRRLVGGEASIGWNERDRSAEALATLLDRRLEAWRAGGDR